MLLFTHDCLHCLIGGCREGMQGDTPPHRLYTQIIDYLLNWKVSMLHYYRRHAPGKVIDRIKTSLCLVPVPYNLDPKKRQA